MTRSSFLPEIRYDEGMPEHDHSGNPTPPPQPPGDGPNIQPFHHDPVSARVPDKVARGVFATGVLVQEGSGEFVLDFVQALTRPALISARVVIAPQVMAALVNTFTDNIARYTDAFGPPPQLPKGTPPAKPPTTQEIYDNLKLPEDILSGAYANSVMIGHHPGEFFLDFITRFFPTAAVSCRIYLAAAQAPKVLETLNGSLQQFYRRQHQHQQAPPQSSPPPNSET
jgi:hypothetical protein